MRSIKLSVLFILFLSTVNFCWAQENKTFQIISKGNATNIQEYQSAIEKANMENYRYRTVSDTLYFDNGLTFVLFSAKQLQQQGILTEIQFYKDPEEKSKHYTNPTFQLAENGNLIALFQPWEK